MDAFLKDAGENVMVSFAVCGLYVVGSSLNGFGNNTSDMDLCLMITNKDVSFAL